MKTNVGSKENSNLNGEWKKHVDAETKKITSGKRRAKSKQIIIRDLSEIKKLLNDKENK
jgi:hypothetical protein